MTIDRDAKLPDSVLLAMSINVGHLPSFQIMSTQQAVGLTLMPCADSYTRDICNWMNWEGSCSPRLHTKIVSIVWGVLSVGYFVIYVYYNARARMRLEKLPYNRFRTGNLLQNWQVCLLNLTCWSPYATARKPHSVLHV